MLFKKILITQSRELGLAIGVRRTGSRGNGKDGAEIGMYPEGREGNLSFQGEMWERSPQTEGEGRIVSIILTKITVANNMEQTCLP